VIEADHQIQTNRSKSKHLFALLKKRIGWQSNGSRPSLKLRDSSPQTPGVELVVGEEATFTLVATNNGNINLTDIVIVIT
jgi:hypothetical protein